MQSKPLPSLQELKDRLSYDPETGIFKWTFYSRSQRYGGIAGRPCPRGYIKIQHNGQNIQMHRIAWLFMTGEDPHGKQIDHLNGNKSDNRWANLRLVEPAINSQNFRRPGLNNTSGFLGVSFCTRTGRFRAYINVNQKFRALGYHDTAEAAHAAYLKAKRELHPGCTI
jgi:hypothetical protein